jgi:peptide/nickel transport system permease protein
MGDRAEHLLLPTLTLAIPSIAIYSRYQRSLMLDTLHADYVRTARAKGLTKRRAVFKHALRTALIPVGTLFAFSLAAVFTGATFTETLFGWHGMGEYLVTSINGQDVNGAVAVAAFGAIVFFVGAVLSEIFVVVLDPRVRVS